MTLTVAVQDDRGARIAGSSAVRASVRNAEGVAQDVSGCYAVSDGVVRVPFGVPMDAAPGRWEVEAKDLANGLEALAPVTVTAR